MRYAFANPGKKRRFRIPYRLLILLISILTTMLILLCLLSFFFGDVSDYVTEKSSNLYVLQTKILSDQAEYMLLKINNIADMLLSDQNFRRAVREYAESEQIADRIEPYNALMKQLNCYALNQQNIANITVFTRENTVSTGYKTILNQNLEDILNYLDLKPEDCREQVRLICSPKDIPQFFVSSIPAGSLFYAAALYEKDAFVGLILVGVREDALLKAMTNDSALYLGDEQICGSTAIAISSEDWNADGEVCVITPNERSVPHVYVRSIVEGSMTFALQEDLDITYRYLAQFQRIMLITLGLVILCAIVISMTLLRRVTQSMAALQQQISTYKSREPESEPRERRSLLSMQSQLSIYLLCTVVLPILLYLGAYYGTANFCIGAQMKSNYQNTFNSYANSLDILFQEYCDAAQMMGQDISGRGATDAVEIRQRLLDDSKIWNLNLNMFLLDGERNIVYATQPQNQSLLEERIRALSFGEKGALITEIPGEIFYAMEAVCMDSAYYLLDTASVHSVVVLLDEKRLQAIYGELCGAELIDVYVCDSEQMIISSNYTHRIGETLKLSEGSVASTVVHLTHVPLTIHFFYNEAQLTDGLMKIVLNRLQSVALIFLGLMMFSSWLSRMLLHPLEHIRHQLDKHDITDITEIYADNSLISEIDSLGNSFNDMKQRIDDLLDDLMRTQKREYQMEMDKHAAELHSLQTQIHPHFLCNLLESIRSLNELGDHAGANAMIRDLGDFFRYSISCDTPMVLLKEEIAFTQAYCNILRRKYCDDIRFEWKCDPSALEMPVLRLLMQPLIENAVYHGLAPRGTKGTVRISVRLQETFLVLEISDDGCGMDEGNLRQGIGLTNVRRRIELYYKEKGTMEIHSQPGTGTCVRLSLPVNV